jgi:alginate O-acetyltransferase complex protein AlgI
MLLRAILYLLATVISIVALARIRSRSVRQLLLLAIGYVLYFTWGRWFAIVLVASTVINFVIGQSLRRKRSPLTLWTGIALNVALLSTFKYVPEIAHSSSIAWLQSFSRVALPLGLSFWTFQAMSYLFDLYGGEPLDPSLLEFALYMTFFPIVISGPICRMPDMLPQFRSGHPPSRHDVWGGLSRIATGLMMMQFAQLLGKGITSGQGLNGGFDQMTSWSGPDVWCLAVGYGLQLFLDFAGYSHMAIGVARMLGFTVPENFARPFTSTTPSIFWTRWHMSLSFWIRDYVFMPMAMLSPAEWWAEFSLLLSMIIFGVWHKGTLLYLLFGCYQGILLIGHRRVQAARKRFKSLKRKTTYGPAFSWFLTMALLALGWIFFRANTPSQAFTMFRAVLTPASYGDRLLPSSLYLLVAALAVGYALTLLVASALDRYSRGEAAPRSAGFTILARDRWVWIAPIYLFVSLAVLLLIHHLPQSGPGPFMYAGY